MKVRRIIRGCTVLYDTIHLEGQEIYIYCYISVNIKKYKQLSCYPLECMNPRSSKLLEDDRILIRRLLTRYCLRSIKSERMQCSYRIICISKSLSYYYYYLAVGDCGVSSLFAQIVGSVINTILFRNIHPFYCPLLGQLN